MAFQPSPRLRFYHLMLAQTLNDFHDSQIRHLQRTDADIRKQHAIIQDINERLRLSYDELEFLRSRLAYLDTTDLDQQQVSGQSDQTHVHKGLHVSPNLFFNLKSYFPIRKHETYLSEGLKWKVEECVYGTFSFKGEVKTSYFKGAQARVVIYGWRREMAATEISGVKKSIEALELLAASLESEVNGQRAKLQSLHHVKQNIETIINICQHDLNTIKLKDGVTRVDEKARQLAEAGSISSLSVHYGLKSTTFDIQSSNTPPGQAAKWLQAAFQSDIEGASKFLADLRAAYVSEASSAAKASDKFNREVNNAFSAYSVLGGAPKELKKLQGADEVLTLAEEAARDISELEKGVRVVQATLKADCAGISASMDKLDGNLFSVSIDAYIEEIICLLEEEEQARAASWATISGDYSARHVGVVSAIRSSENMCDAWMSIYEGAKILKV